MSILKNKAKRTYATVKIGVVAASLLFAALPSTAQADIASGHGCDVDDDLSRIGCGQRQLRRFARRPEHAFTGAFV